AWTAVRRRVTPGKKFDARAWTEIKKFSLIGWAGLAPGLASLGTTLATRDAVQGFVAGSIVQAANSPIQGLLSAMLERRLGNKGQSLDMQQNQQIKALTGRVNSLQKQNAELTQRLDDLVQRLDMRGPGPGGGQGPGGGPGQGPGSGPGQGPGSGPGGGPGSRARSKEESRSEGRGRGGPAKGSAKSGNGRTGSGKSERPTAPKPKREPRSR
ncbi:MAG: hypothetical protein J2P24_16615, partial [Streptosporangiales bacterium]|nr:hypothetical protein [Streptosporangiales bacterium]